MPDLTPSQQLFANVADTLIDAHAEIDVVRGALAPLARQIRSRDGDRIAAALAERYTGRQVVFDVLVEHGLASAPASGTRRVSLEGNSLPDGYEWGTNVTETLGWATGDERWETFNGAVRYFSLEAEVDLATGETRIVSVEDMDVVSPEA